MAHSWFISATDFVFDGKGTKPYKTDEPVAPLPVTLMADPNCSASSCFQANAPSRWIIARTAWLYGRHASEISPAPWSSRGKANLPLKVVNDQIGSPTYTEDLAAATLSI